MSRQLLSVLPALVLLCAGAIAQTPKTYVLQATSWSNSQTAAVTAAGGTLVFSHAASGLAAATSSAPNFAAAVKASGAVSVAVQDRMVQWTPNTGVMEISDLGQGVAGQAITPANETFWNLQWAPKAVEGPAAWAAGCTGKNVRVAILDGGIHSGHIDLVANLDVAASKSFVPNQPFNADTGTFWHGTHVAGIVAAADNGIGTIGIAPEARLIGVKVLHSGSGSFSWVIQGILYAATPLPDGAGARIINMSLGAVFPKNDPDVRGLVAALNRAVNFATDKGVLVVSAAGNDGLDLDHSGNVVSVPAQSGSGIAVSATGPLGFGKGATNYRRVASYTNYGNSAINVAAPGGDFMYVPDTELCSIPRYPSGTVTTNCWALDMVMSTVRGGSNASYGWAAGTSMAAPAASAVAAILVQRYPGILVGDLKTLLQQTADDEGRTGNDPYYGKGFVNARRACMQ